MPTSQELLVYNKQVAIKQGQQEATPKYEGPIDYRGELINPRHSIKRVVHTLRQSLKRSQFASLNLVGIPGSGKTTCAVNIITDLIEEEAKTVDGVTGQFWQVHWYGAEDLRNLGDILEDLPKFQNHITVFDDVSKALEKLSAAEQAEIFEQLTTTRHVTGGKLLMVSLYHYSFANLKSMKSQGAVVIYTSVTLTEFGNLQQILSSARHYKTLKKFSRVYESAHEYDQFQLNISKNQIKNFADGKPFRPCLVINLFKAHIGLFMKLENGFNPPKEIKQKISVPVLLQKITDSPTYERDGKLALRILAMLRGHPEAMRTQFVCAYKFVVDLTRGYQIDWGTLAEAIKDRNSKRLYRHKKQEAILRDAIIKESKEITKSELIQEEEVHEEADESDGLEEF